MAIREIGIWVTGGGSGNGAYFVGSSNSDDWQINQQRNTIRTSTKSHFSWLSDNEVCDIVDSLSDQKIERIYASDDYCNYDFVPHEHRIRVQREKIESLQIEIKKCEEKIDELCHEELVIKLAGIGE
jgi:hypothetical protein